jgi:hypothetical protein
MSIPPTQMTRKGLMNFNFRRTLLDLKGHRVYEQIAKFPWKFPELQTLKVRTGNDKSGVGVKFFAKNKSPIIRFHNEHVEFSYTRAKLDPCEPVIELTFSKLFWKVSVFLKSFFRRKWRKS